VSRRKTIKRRNFGALLALLAVAPTTGCLFSTGSLIEKGESVETGRRRFDNYFEEVSALREKVDKLDSDLFPLRQPLVEELDVSVDIALGDLLEETKKRVTKAKDFGVSMTLRLRPTPTVVEGRGDVESEDKQATLIKAIEESANRAMQSFEQYSLLLDEASALDKKRAELAERIDKLPPDADKGLIEREIKGAGVVIRGTEKKLIKDTRTISHFLVGLVASVDTGATESHQTRCDEAIAFHEQNKKKPKPKPRGRPRWRPRPGGGRPAAPKPAPKPKPAGGGDFEM
jgi:hypothetical protein